MALTRPTVALSVRAALAISSLSALEWVPTKIQEELLVHRFGKSTRISALHGQQLSGSLQGDGILLTWESGSAVARMVFAVEGGVQIIQCVHA